MNGLDSWGPKIAGKIFQSHHHIQGGSPTIVINGIISSKKWPYKNRYIKPKKQHPYLQGSTPRKLHGCNWFFGSLIILLHLSKTPPHCELKGFSNDQDFIEVSQATQPVLIKDHGKSEVSTVFFFRRNPDHLQPLGVSGSSDKLGYSITAMNGRK